MHHQCYSKGKIMIDIWNMKEEPKATTSNQAKLLDIVGDAKRLRLVKGSDEIIDLDDPRQIRQVKVKAKILQFYNLIFGVKQNQSNIIKLCVSELMNKERVSAPTLAEMLMTKGDYSVGTAKAQAGQMMMLFRVLKMVVPDRHNVYRINEQSLLVPLAMQKCMY